MQVQTRQGPAFGVARLTLGPNEPVKVEGGAMMAMSPTIDITTSTKGGLMKGLRRSLGGESFFMNTFTATQQGDQIPFSRPSRDVFPRREPV